MKFTVEMNFTEARAAFDSGVMDKLDKVVAKVNGFEEVAKPSEATEKKDNVTRIDEKATKSEHVEAETKEKETGSGKSEGAVSVVELRALTKEKAKADRPGVKALLQEFEASSVTNLAEEHYENYYIKLKELG